MRLVLLLVFFYLLGCGGETETSSSLSPTSIEGPAAANGDVDLRHVMVDNAAIESGDVDQIVAPMAWAVNFYGDLSDYEVSLQPFSQAQRDVFLVAHYIDEMENGGHNAFFFQDGICWPETLEAFERTGLDSFAALLKQALAKFSRPPSRDYEERERQLERASPNFESLDERYYEIVDNATTDATLQKYIQDHRADLLFDGQVVVPDY